MRGWGCRWQKPGMRSAKQMCEGQSVDSLLNRDKDDGVYLEEAPWFNQLVIRRTPVAMNGQFSPWYKPLQCLELTVAL